LAGDLAGTATAPVIATGVITSAKILDATIVTADLADNSITSVKIADGAITNTNISSAAAIADTKLTTIATAGKVSNSATTATSANTASTIVARDASGNFNAGTITANLTGNAANVTGTIAAANGGTGQTSYTTGDLLYASSSTAVAKLADVATGNALISKGIGFAPSYGKIDLTTTVSGTLPVANGGTGATALVANSVLLGNGTSTLQTIAPGTTGNVLTSNGSTWTSAAGPTYSKGLNASLGGYVFYVTPDFKHGLVAETQDHCSACNWTDANNENSRPANHSTNGKGFTDWRLPTRYEIIMMNEAKSDTWWTGVVTGNCYWSSSEDYTIGILQGTVLNGKVAASTADDWAYYLTFQTANLAVISNSNKMINCRARAIRSF
jgi:hypothetical protein